MAQRAVSQRHSVAVGSPVTIGPETLPLASPCSVAAIPGSSGTMLVEYQIAPGGTWFSWPGGAVSANTVYLLTGPVYAMRFTAATTAGVVEIAQ